VGVPYPTRRPDEGTYDESGAAFHLSLQCQLPGLCPSILINRLSVQIRNFKLELSLHQVTFRAFFFLTKCKTDLDRYRNYPRKFPSVQKSNLTYTLLLCHVFRVSTYRRLPMPKQENVKCELNLLTPSSLFPPQRCRGSAEPLQDPVFLRRLINSCGKEVRSQMEAAKDKVEIVRVMGVWAKKLGT